MDPFEEKALETTIAYEQPTVGFSAMRPILPRVEDARGPAVKPQERQRVDCTRGAGFRDA